MPILAKPIPELSDKDLERFWSKVDKGDGQGCWTWNRALDVNGYGKFGVKQRVLFAHRVSYVLANGEPPDDAVLDHLCRNTKCVRPDHLEAVSNRENTSRSPLAHENRAHCVHGHELSGANVWVQANGHRVCRECKRIRMRESYYKKRPAKEVPLTPDDATLCPSGHPLFIDNVYVKFNGTWRCKTCHTGQEKRRRHRLVQCRSSQ